MASSRPPLKKIQALKRLAESAAKYTPLLRTGARLASFAGAATHSKPLRAIGHVLRGLHLAASLARGIQQVRQFKQQGQGRAPSPRPTPRAPRSPSSAGPLPPRPPALKPLPSPRAPTPARNWPQQASGPSATPKPGSTPQGPQTPPYRFPMGPGTPAAFPHWTPPKPTSPAPGTDAPSTPRARPLIGAALGA